MASRMTTRSGFVALIGEPNAGKSTLTNTLVGAKVSIVTHKVQTTRARIRGVALDGDAQIVLVDTLFVDSKWVVGAGVVPGEIPRKEIPRRAAHLLSHDRGIVLLGSGCRTLHATYEA